MPEVDPVNIQMPMFIAESDWKPPAEPPNLSGVKRLGVDTETCDPNLKQMGPGFIRGDAYPIGASLATEDKAWYFPFAHPEDNCEWDVKAWLKDILELETDKVGANLAYEMQAFHVMGIHMKGRLLDVQNAEPLLDEERVGGYSLDVLAKHYLGDEKDETLLREAATQFGIDPKSEMYKLPARFVGEYAEHDAVLPLQILDKQMPMLKAQGLIEVFDMETELMHLVHAMKLQGVRVDVERAEEISAQWKKQEIILLDDIKRECKGLEVDPWKPKSLSRLCVELGVLYERTPKGNPSFGNEWFLSQQHTGLNKIGEYRKLNKMRRDFIDGMILKHNINGRLHAQFHALRQDDYGTRSGRFSSSDPNLQQVPARDPYYGPMIRGLFLPEEGEEWMCADYASQEPRLTIHFAYLMAKLAEEGKIKFSQKAIDGVNKIVAQYRKDPDTDLHRWTADICKIPLIERYGEGFNIRAPAKQINLGMTYGMGLEKLAQELGCSEREAKPIFDVYHNEMAFIGETAQTSIKAANRRGWVSTIMGRRRRFKMDHGRRQYTHKSFNAVVQGSGADMMKKAMLDVWKETKKIPLTIVHDENNYSVIKDKKLQKWMSELMRDAVPLEIPNKVDYGIGNNWAEAK